MRVRLAGIDAPELGQPYSRRARSPVGFVFGKDVTLIVQDRDRYGRTVVQVKVADLEVSAELVRIGAAWAYRAYLTDRTLLNLEAVAKEFKRGLCPLSKAERKAPGIGARPSAAIPFRGPHRNGLLRR
ncbi:thermonuclease family protein [Stutzerimonas nitrititolerans]|uniref:thermonuclease family protein n=1 Tax=Stutzerimonas nitrititolerans TaxID=2482751 RepID=UPI0028AA82F5|nr:thermonuclease family protein [Stutzerimonas nitrititolerans]